MTISIQNAVARLTEARSTSHSISPFSATDEDFTVEHAWAIQDALCSEMARRGKAPIGWKLAATGPTGQAVMSVTEPAYGFLLADPYVSPASVSRSGFVELGVEAEIAFKIGKALTGPGVTATTAFEAVESIMPALELPDLIFSGTPKIADFIASSMLPKGIVLGNEFKSLKGLDLANEKIVFAHNGEIVGTNMGHDVMGNPLNALAWLANQLGARGYMLKPGDIVMSGGISKLLRANVGDTIHADFRQLGSVSMKVAA